MTPPHRGFAEQAASARARVFSEVSSGRKDAHCLFERRAQEIDSQTPAWHESFAGSPSPVSQAVPSTTGVSTPHTPVTGLHSPAVAQGLDDEQVTSAQRSVGGGGGVGLGQRQTGGLS